MRISCGATFIPPPNFSESKHDRQPQLFSMCNPRDREPLHPEARRRSSRDANLAATRCRGQPGSRHSRVRPVSQTRWNGPSRRDDASVVRGARLRWGRVDLRGSGDSEGLLDDEYAPQEQEDGLAIIDWLSSQPWCSGSVGMIGISWGGFNGLQIAARRPEPLKATISVGSTNDRYADDVHYMGGAQLRARP